MQNLTSDHFISKNHVFVQGEIALGFDGWFRRAITTASRTSDAKIFVTFDSDGGMLTPTEAAVEYLQREVLKPTVAIIENASSAAAILALACDQRIVFQDSEFMLHNVFLDEGFISDRNGTAKDFRLLADVLAGNDRWMIDLAQKACGQPIRTVEKWFDAERVFVGRQVAHAGLASLHPGSRYD